MFLKRDTRLNLISVILSIGGGYLLSNYTPLAALLETYMSYKYLLTILLSLFFVLCLMIPYTYYLKKQNSNTDNDNKINIDDYDQPKELCGISKHKKTGKLYCTSCLIKNTKSPALTKTPKEDGWYCPLDSCLKQYLTTSYWNDFDKHNNSQTDRIFNPNDEFT